jgi:hypothetical protein
VSLAPIARCEYVPPLAGTPFVRWEYYPTNFLGFVRLAALFILLKQF